MKDKDDILALGYQSAISLWIFEGEVLWTRFSAMLMTHTVILGVIGLLFNDQRELTSNAPIFLVLSLVGFILSLFWFEMTSRGFSMMKYHTLAAREIEDKINSIDLEILKKGYHFSKNESVKFKITEDTLKTHTRPWHSQLFRTETAASYTIVLVGIFYLILFTASLCSII